MLESDIHRFASNVVKEARSNAQKDFPKGGGKLANSISYDLQMNPEGFRLSFSMEEYGMFKDAGVFGAMKSSTPKMAWAVKNIKQKGKQSNSVFLDKNVRKFTYKSAAPPMNSLLPYIQRNRIRFRTPKGSSEGGQFRPGSYTTIAYWMAQRIFAQGAAPSLFFTKPFIKYFENLPDEIAELIAEQLGSKLNRE